MKGKRQFNDFFKHKDKKKHAESSTIPQAEVESTLFKVCICYGGFIQNLMITNETIVNVYDY